MEKEKTYTIKFGQQELEDLWSALGYFIREYPEKAPETKKAMKKVLKKIRETMKG